MMEAILSTVLVSIQKSSRIVCKRHLQENNQVAETMISTLVLVLMIQLAQSQTPCNVFHNASCPMEPTNLVCYVVLAIVIYD